MIIILNLTFLIKINNQQYFRLLNWYNTVEIRDLSTKDNNIFQHRNKILLHLTESVVTIINAMKLLMCQ